jgi:hypothetical protein
MSSFRITDELHDLDMIAGRQRFCHRLPEPADRLALLTTFMA